MTRYNVLSLFDGMECGLMALDAFPIGTYYASEVDPHAIKQSKHSFPDTIHLGDVRGIDVGKLEPIDLLIGGSPCFTANTPVVKNDGIVAIKDVKEEDMVLTHNHKYQRVLAIGKKKGIIYNVSAQGVFDIETTEEHPFYVRTMKRSWDNEKRTSFRDFSEPKWKTASLLKKGDFIGVPVLQSSTNPLGITDEEAFILGRYIADGHTRKDYRTSEGRPNHRYWQIILSIGASKLDEFKSQIKEHHYSCYLHTENVYRVVFSSKRLVEIAEEHCGIGASSKRISKSLLDLPKHLLSLLLEGYLMGDGHEFKPNKYSIVSISKELILTLGLAILKVYNVGYSVSVYNPPKRRMLLNRIVNQNIQYILRFSKCLTKQANYKVVDNICWFPVKNVKKTNIVETVYNLEVDEDNSYTANGAIVHNCQSFSFSGKRKGMSSKCSVEILTLSKYLEMKEEKFDFEGQSYLFWEYVRVLNDIRQYNPDVLFLLENVEMTKKWERVLSEGIGIFGVHINAALVSAQNRKRIYWTNIRTKRVGLFGELHSDIPQPEDRGILLKDVLEGEVDEKYYLSDRAVSRLLNYTQRQRERGNGFASKFHHGDEKMSTLKVGGSGCYDLVQSGFHSSIKTGEDKSSAILASQHKLPRGMDLIQDPICAASRGRGDGNEQKLETRGDGKTNTLTSVSKDNLIVQGNIYPSGGQNGVVYNPDGKAPTLSSGEGVKGRGIGSSNSPKILVQGCIKFGRTEEAKRKRKQSMKGGKDHTPFTEKEITGVDTEKMSTLTTATSKDNLIMQLNPSTESGGKLRGVGLEEMEKSNTVHERRIRRLTVRECCLLQTIPEEYHEWVVSDTQAYRMLGNGWCVEVIRHIFSFLPWERK